MNVIRVHAKVGKIQEAEAFAQEYAQYLNIEDENLLASIHARAACHIGFEKGEYQAVLDNIEKIKVRDKPKHLIDRHIFYFKASYELGKTDNILDKEVTFSNYLKDNYERQQLGLDYKICYQNFFDLLVMMINFRYEGYTKTLLLDKLHGFQGLVAESKWLKAKIAKL